MAPLARFLQGRVAAAVWRKWANFALAKRGRKYVQGEVMTVPQEETPWYGYKEEQVYLWDP